MKPLPVKWWKKKLLYKRNIPLLSSSLLLLSTTKKKGKKPCIWLLETWMSKKLLYGTKRQYETIDLLTRERSTCHSHVWIVIDVIQHFLLQKKSKWGYQRGMVQPDNLKVNQPLCWWFWLVSIVLVSVSDYQMVLFCGDWHSQSLFTTMLNLFNVFGSLCT